MIGNSKFGMLTNESNNYSNHTLYLMIYLNFKFLLGFNKPFRDGNIYAFNILVIKKEYISLVNLVVID